jgi:hypothetical protein
MLDNVVKVDGLTSLSVSEKRKGIKSITGDQFGWGNIPDLMPIEKANNQTPINRNIQNATDPSQQNDPNLPGLPQPTPDTSVKPDSKPAGQPTDNGKSIGLTEETETEEQEI